MALVLGVLRFVRWFRIVFRFVALVSVFAFAGMEFVIRGGWRWGESQRARWLHEWSAVLLKRLNVSVRFYGEAPLGGMWVPNHLSYLDVPVLAVANPVVFLSKSEVEGWPVVGWYTRMAGTLFIDRSRRSEVAKKREAFEAVVNGGVGLSVFLEGTSSNGEAVLPFRSSLLQSAVEGQWSLTPIYIAYEATGGDASNEVCWWGDAPFAGHFINLLGLEGVKATVVFGEQRQASDDRKVLAEELREAVLGLKERLEVGGIVEAFGKRESSRRLEV